MASKDPKVLFDIDTGENTFITGGGVPGKKKFAEEEFKEEKIYQNEEDKLLDDVDNLENGMKEMMKYLQEVESSMNGGDLEAIKRMMKCTDQSMDQHISHYDQLKSQVDDLNQGAISAMKRIGKHNPDVARMVLDSEQRSRAHGTKVAILEEDREDEGETASASIHVGGARGQQRLSDMPLES